MSAARVGLFVGPLLAVLVYILHPESMSETAARTASVAILMATWWTTGALPLAATALIPLIAFPFLGVAAGGAVASSYANDIIFLFIGGFLVAIAMEESGLHRRLALRILLFFGFRPAALLLGFLVATAFLSMWISNTATAMIMVPIASALLLKLGEIAGIDKVKPFASAVLIGIAYAASIGGVATLVGTPPNLVIARTYQQVMPDAAPLEFTPWLLFAGPLSLCLLGLAWGWLMVMHRADLGDAKAAGEVFHEQYRSLGHWTRDERFVAVVFATLAILWITRPGLDFGFVRIPGWSQLLPDARMVTDGTTAMLCAFVLFLIPSIHSGGLLNTKSILKLPWDIVLLFGGGFALADVFLSSGLAEWFGGQLGGLSGIHPILMVLIICLSVTFLTEVTSNTASAQLLMPLLAAHAIATGLDPRLLMIAGGISCSMAFMLPVATPPNAIVFATGKITPGEMLRAGLFMNIAGAIAITLAMWLLAPWALGVRLN